MTARCRPLLALLATLLAMLAGVWPAPTMVQADDLLTVHIIAHSHCDPGWLNTFEGYYLSEVKTILDAVLRELQNHDNRKFVWSEISFFNRWYEQLQPTEKAAFKSLVQRGQIEFVNGGWVQNDESSPDPTAMLNQMSTGHEYLLKNFGIAPRIGWQIDPFGHSAVTPSLWSLMGFEALVTNRIHHALKDSFKQRKDMEFMWRGVDMGQKTDMFTHVLHTHYSAPQGFDWEEGAMGVDTNNVGQRASELANIMRSRATAYRTPHLLVPFGDDFKFKQAERQFSNMERIIAHINANPSTFGMRAQFSTLSDYFSAVAAEKVKFPVFEGDFFPYADNFDSYWTGYFTTRPLLKKKSRELNHILRACESLVVLVRSSPHANQDSEQRQLSAGFWESKFREVERARMETALFLHHDAITGTSRTNVVADYLKRMEDASAQLMQIMTRMVEHLLTREPNASPTLTPDPLVLGPSEEALASSNSDAPLYHPVVFFNSLAWDRIEVVSVAVSSRNTRVLDGEGVEVPSQIDVVWRPLESNTELAPLANRFTVSFLARVPPLGAATYYLLVGRGVGVDESKSESRVTQSMSTVYASPEKKSRGQAEYKSKYLSYEASEGSTISIENAFLLLTFNPRTGLVSSVTQKGEGGKSFDFQHSFGQYQSHRSGAYLFRPAGKMEPFTLGAGDDVAVRVTRGPIVSTVSVRIHGFDVVTALYGGDDASPDVGGHFAVTSTIDAGANQEVVSLFSSADFPTHEREFFTNSGVDFMRRTSKDGNNLAQNFYPMVLGARMASRSLKRAFTIFNAHSMAVGSHKDGELELVMHRSLAQDDGRGLAEPVNDPSRPDVPLWISFDPDMSDHDFRVRSIRLNNPLRTFYKLPTESHDAFMKQDHVDSPEEWARRQHVSFSPLRAPLPPHVHLQSLFVRDAVGDDVVVRFQHLSREADLAWVGSFQELFDPTFAVSEVRRATLSLNTVLPMNGHRKRSMKFDATDDAPSSPYNELGGGDAAGGASPGASQNTEEEGVFISQASLEKLRADQQNAANAAAAAASRRLLEQQDLEGGLLERSVDVSLPVASSAARRLFAPQTPTHLFVLKPLQLQTYIFRMTGSEWAEQAQGVMVGVGETQGDRTVVRTTPPPPRPRRETTTPPATPRASPDTIRTDPRVVKVTAQPPTGKSARGVDLETPATRVSGGPSYDRSKVPTSANVLHGHEHTVIPGRTREAWKLIPSRWEYIVVLCLTLGAVAFFLQAMRVIARAGGNASSETVPLKRNKRSAV